MGFQEIKNLIIPMIAIGFGLFIKTTKNENYQNVKSRWKPIVIFGVVYLIIKIVNLFV